MSSKALRGGVTLGVEGYGDDLLGADAAATLQHLIKHDGMCAACQCAAAFTAVFDM
jgi:hypothetical protein